MELWKRDSWLNPGIPYLFNRTIVEYDIQSAGLSLIKEFQLLPKETIHKLDQIHDKETRNKKIGLLERENKELVEKKKLAFQIVREAFMKQNELEDQEILSIKKDAIFTTREVPHTEFGSYVSFKKKHQYTSYLRVGKRKIELYYHPTAIDVKGIGDEMLPLHEPGMLAFFASFLRRMETGKAESTLRFLRGILDQYKSYDLPVDYYREFNARSCYTTVTGEEFMEYWEDRKQDLDITYNYFILCNLPKILL